MKIYFKFPLNTQRSLYFNKITQKNRSVGVNIVFARVDMQDSFSLFLISVA